MTEINQNNKIEQLESLLEDDKQNSFIMFALAKEYEKLDEFEKAIEIFEDLRIKDPEYIGLYYHLASLYDKYEIRDKAIHICSEGIDICKTTGDSHALSELQNLKMNIEIS